MTEQEIQREASRQLAATLRDLCVKKGRKNCELCVLYDGVEYQFKANIDKIQYAADTGREIPYECYHGTPLDDAINKNFNVLWKAGVSAVEIEKTQRIMPEDIRYVLDTHGKACVFSRETAEAAELEKTSRRGMLSADKPFRPEPPEQKPEQVQAVSRSR